MNSLVVLFILPQSKYLRQLVELYGFYLVILLIVCHTVLVMFILRIWYFDQLIIPQLIFFLFSWLVYWILYWYCREKFSLGHWWELKCSEISVLNIYLDCLFSILWLVLNGPPAAMFCLLVSINRTVLQQSWTDTWTCHFPFFIEQVFDFVLNRLNR